MLLREPLKDRARGRWRGILSAIGVPEKALRNRHGPCPMCGGKDRFRFDDKDGRGTWFCNQCGAGDGIELVKKFQGVEFKEAAAVIERHMGDAPITAARGGAPTDMQVRKDMEALWKRSTPITGDDLAGRYLIERGITFMPDKVRFAADERYVDPDQRPVWMPVMVAKVEPSDAAAANGERAALHRTYLSQLGGKAEVASPRKMMGTMPIGAAVRLMPHAEILGIAEGIETALSAAALYNMPVWAALNAGLLADWTPPAKVTTVFIFGDNDASATGQAAAYGLAQRLQAKGIAVQVKLPTRTGQDWNDVLRSKEQART